MRLRTIILLGAAAVCAGVATLLTTFRIAPQPNTVRVVSQNVIAPDTKTIVVALRDLPFGTKLEKSMLQEVAWPAKLLPTGAFSKLDRLVGRPNGKYSRVVLRPITKGEPILTTKVSKPGQRPSLSGALENAKSAVTIRVDDVQGVAGFIQPDDHVDVLLTRKSFERGASKTGATKAFTDILLQNVKVLAVDQRFVRSTSAKPARAVTLEVDQVQAQKLVLAASVGKLSLTLRNSFTSPAGKPRRISLDDLPGVAPDTSSRSDGQTAIADDKGGSPVVSIVRGTGQRQVYEVLEDRSSVRLIRRSFVPTSEPQRNLQNSEASTSGVSTRAPHAPAASRSAGASGEATVPDASGSQAASPPVEFSFPVPQ